MKQNSPIKEQALRTEQSVKKLSTDAPAAQGEGVATAAATTSCAEALDERICIALRASGDKKALDPVILDLREVASFTDHFLITSGTNTRQVQAIADEVVEQLKRSGTRAARVEGYRTAEWVLVDYGDFVVHVFEEKARRFYDLERLWRDAVRVAVPAEFADGAGASADSSQRSEA